MKPGRRRQLLRILQLVEGEAMTVKAACADVGIHPATFYRHRRTIQEDARVRTMRETMRDDCDTERAKVIDSLQERGTDLEILNHLLGHLVKGVTDGLWTPGQVEARLISLVDAKGRLLSGVDRATQMVQSLTLVDARSITFEEIPEEIQEVVQRRVCEDIWKQLCPSCKEAVQR